MCPDGELKPQWTRLESAPEQEQENDGPAEQQLVG